MARRLTLVSAGLLANAPIRRRLAAAGWDTTWRAPGPQDAVGVWGRGRTEARGAALAARHGVPLVRIEEAFLRGLRPGRAGGGPPLGLLIDPDGVHYDGASKIERLARENPLDEAPLLRRAHDGIARLKAGNLSKYNDFDPALPTPPPGYVLVIDQVAGDAALRAPGPGLREILARAMEDHPRARILIRGHPETRAGRRPGHFGPADSQGRVLYTDDPLSPWALLEGAIAVYTHSSLMGFEAVLAGHRPRVFGRPFYAGWGLTEDAAPLPRRDRRLTAAQLFAVSHILAPDWHDPCRDRPCSFEEAVDQLEAEVRAFREDRAGHVATGMRLWKRAHLQREFGRERPLRFAADPARALARARAEGRGLLIWAGAEPEGFAGAAAGVTVRRVEDGFLRSRGLGAALVPPLSVIADPVGIHHDPTRPSALEALVAAGPPPGGRDRAARLIARLVATGVTKYAPDAAPLPELPTGHRILVPGQVEDDASVRLGAGAVKTNRALLEAVRAARPDAVILYKPHPDVAAGLRAGACPEAAEIADAVLPGADPAALIAAADEVWTITSTMGFEALLRGRPVTCLGAPFYAGWGLTRDLGPVPARRQARPDLAAFVHAALIAYPRYRDPPSGRPCPAEVVADRLASGPIPAPGPGLRLLSKAQGAVAGWAFLWR